MFHVCHAVLSVDCSLVVTCWERAGFLALLCVMSSCVFVTFPCVVQSQVWYLIVLIPELCLLPYFIITIDAICGAIQGSNELWKSWKTWKITKTSSMHGKIKEFEKNLIIMEKS